MLDAPLYNRGSADSAFPPFLGRYYTYNILGGIDEDGKGCIFSFDPVGSYEREFFRAAGTANTLLQPLLDNQLGYKNQNTERVPMAKEKAINLVKVQ